MRSRTLITLLCCGFCLLAAGCTHEMTSTDGAATVKPEERAATSGEPAQTPQAEPPAGEVHERGILPGVMAPPPTTKVPGPLYVAPTADLTKIANALVVHTKSLSIVVKFNPGLVLTHPVYIRVDVSSPGYVGNVQEPKLVTCGVFSPTPPCYDVLSFPKTRAH